DPGGDRRGCWAAVGCHDALGARAERRRGTRSGTGGQPAWCPVPGCAPAGGRPRAGVLMTAGIDQVRRTVLDTQRPGGAGVPPGVVSRAVRTSPGVRTDAAQLALERVARSEMLGAGPVLQPLLDDQHVGDSLEVRPERLPDPRRLATRLA